MPTERRLPLRFGLVAVIVSDEQDRPPYVPPPMTDREHHERCGCDRCVGQRVLRR